MTKLPVGIYNCLTLYERFPEFQINLLCAGARSINKACEEQEMKATAIGRGMVRGFYRKAKTFCDWSKIQKPYGGAEEIILAYKRSRGMLWSWGEI